MLEAWAGTSGRLNPWKMASTSIAVQYSVVSETPSSLTIRYEANGAQIWAPGTTGSYVDVRFESAQYYEDYRYPDGITRKVLTAEARDILRRLWMLEAFNGERFVDFQRTVAKISLLV